MKGGAYRPRRGVAGSLSANTYQTSAFSWEQWVATYNETTRSIGSPKGMEVRDLIVFYICFFFLGGNCRWNISDVLSNKSNFKFPQTWTFYFWIYLLNKHFVQNGSPGQITMLDQSGSKFCVEPRYQNSGSSHVCQIQFENTKNSFLAWMSTWTSRWRRRRRRRPKKFPKSARAPIHHVQVPNIPFRNPSLRCKTPASR